jgi:hypothetical protein
MCHLFQNMYVILLLSFYKFWDNFVMNRKAKPRIVNNVQSQ